MAEEKKKNTTTKATNNQKKKTTNNKKTTTTKKTNNQNKRNTNKKVNQNNKQQPKKNTTKKVTPKKEETKKEVKKLPKKIEEEKKIEEPIVVEEKVEEPEKTVVEEIIEEVTEGKEEPEESILEKTLIFDGRENQNLAEVVEKLEEENVVLEDKIIKRSKAKKIAVNILITLIFITIIGTIIFVIWYEIQEENNSQTLNSNIFDKVSHKYDDTSEIDTEQKTELDLGKEDYENIETITLGEFEKNILDKKDMIVIVASTTCYYSMEYEPIVDEVFKELDKTIYRINITSLTNEETKRFRTYYAFEETPTIFKVENGVVTKELVGKQEKEDLTKWLK